MTILETLTGEELEAIKKAEPLDTAICADIISRILAGRTMNVCLNSVFSCIYGWGSDMVPEGRAFLIDALKTLTVKLEEIKPEQAPDKMGMN